MKKKYTERPAKIEGRAGGGVQGENGRTKTDNPGDIHEDYPEDGGPGRDADSGAYLPPNRDEQGYAVEGSVPRAASGPAPDSAMPDDAVFQDIIRKAGEGNIKYQELYLKYIDLISGRTADKDEVVYEATFVDDKDKEA